MPLPDSDLGLGTLESGGYLKESIHRLLNKVEKMHLKPSPQLHPSGSFCSLCTQRHSEVLFAHLAGCGKVPPIKVWRNGFVANNLCC